MKRIFPFALAILLAGCSTTNSYQMRDASADGIRTRTVIDGPKGTSVVESWDSTAEYRECLRTVNRRQIGGMPADEYCRDQTRSPQRQGNLGYISHWGSRWGSSELSGPTRTYHPPANHDGPHRRGASPDLANEAQNNWIVLDTSPVRVGELEERARNLEDRTLHLMEQSVVDNGRIRELERQTGERKPPATNPPAAAMQTASPHPATDEAPPPSESATIAPATE
jgi:hypothetical protein